MAACQFWILGNWYAVKIEISESILSYHIHRTSSLPSVPGIPSPPVDISTIVMMKYTGQHDTIPITRPLRPLPILNTHPTTISPKSGTAAFSPSGQAHTRYLRCHVIPTQLRRATYSLTRLIHSMIAHVSILTCTGLIRSSSVPRVAAPGRAGTPGSQPAGSASFQNVLPYV
jgi:hypothetical protein